MTGGLGKSSSFCTGRMKWGGENTRAAAAAGGAAARKKDRAAASPERGYRKVTLIAKFPCLGSGQPGSLPQTCSGCKACREGRGDPGWKGGPPAHMTILMWHAGDGRGSGCITEDEVQELKRIVDRYNTFDGYSAYKARVARGVTALPETQAYLWNGHLNGVDIEHGPLGKLIGECKQLRREGSPAYALHVSGGLCEGYRRPFDEALLQRHPGAREWVEERKARDPSLATGWELPLSLEMTTRKAALPENRELYEHCEGQLMRERRGQLGAADHTFLQAICNADCVITSSEQAKQDVHGIGRKNSQRIAQYFGE